MRSCTIADCDRTHYGHGWCQLHYRRMRNTGTTADPPPPPTSCTIDDCDREHYARGWCKVHYMRWFRTGLVADRVAIETKSALPVL